MFGLKPEKVKLEKNEDGSVKLLTRERMQEIIDYTNGMQDAKLQLVAILSNSSISIQQPKANRGYYEVRLGEELLFVVDSEQHGWVTPNRELLAPLRFHKTLETITNRLSKDDIIQILELKLNATLNIDKFEDM